MNRSRQIKIGAILSYFSIAFNIIAGLLYTPWMVRQIGQSQYGLYTLATSLITLFLVDFGLSSATARYVSKYHAEGNEDRINTFLGSIYQLYFVIDAVILIALTVVYFLTDVIYKTLTPEELQQFKVVYVIAASFSVVNFPFTTLNGILTSYELFIQQKLADVLHRALTIILVIIALVNGMGLYALVAANALSGLVVIVFKLYMIHKHTHVKVIFGHIDKGILKELFGFSLWITIASLAQRLIFNITPSILGAFASSSAIAVFGIVTTIEGYTFTITNAINGMFMPKISRIVAGNDSENSIQPLFIRVGSYQYILNGLIVSGFFVIGREFIQLWMGSNYSDAYIGIMLVLIPGLFYNALQIGHTTIIVENKVKITAVVNVITGLINVGLSCVFSRIWGVIGASFSIFVAYMVRSIALMYCYNKYINLNIAQFCKNCFLRFSPVIFFTCIIGWLFNSMVQINSWISLACEACALCFIYAFTLLLCIERTERNHILGKIKGIFVLSKNDK